MFDGNYIYQPDTPNSYLTTGYYFWTMTPAGGYNPYGDTIWVTTVFDVNPNGNVNDGAPTQRHYLKPVINISSDVTVLGEGTVENPYTFSL